MALTPKLINSSNLLPWMSKVGTKWEQRVQKGTDLMAKYDIKLMETKMQELAEIEGFDDAIDFLEEFAHDSICPAICMNEGCSYTSMMEPDQDEGYCEDCGSNTLMAGTEMMFYILP